MNKKKNIILITLSILSILAISNSIFSIHIFDSVNTYVEYYNYIDDIPQILLNIIPGIVLPLILLIKYIIASKNNDKYHNLTKFENTYIFLNIVILIIGIVDLCYCQLYLNKLNTLMNQGFSVFMICYIFIFEFMNLLLLIWLKLLNKEKVKKDKIIIIKFINNIVALILFGLLYLVNPGILFVFFVLQAIFLIFNIRKIIYNKKYNIFLLAANILMLIIFVISLIYN